MSSAPPPGWNSNPPPPPGFGAAPPPGFGAAPPPGYGAPPPAYGGGPSWGGGMPARDHPSGTTVLVLGIVSLAGTFICGILALLGPFAWIKGNSVLKEIDANPGAYTNRGAVNAGRICGIVSTVLLAIGVAVVVIIIIAAAAGSGTS